MKPITNTTWREGYAYHPFQTKTTEINFTYSRNHNSETATAKSCNISAIWTPRIQETLINGVLQGRKQTDPRGASALSKIKMWELFQRINGLIVGGSGVPIDLPYYKMKELDHLAVRRQVKEETKREALKGWDG